MDLSLQLSRRWQTLLGCLLLVTVLPDPPDNVVGIDAEAPTCFRTGVTMLNHQVDSVVFEQCPLLLKHITGRTSE